MTDTPEFSHSLKLHDIGAATKRLMLEADVGQRAALAARFGLLSLDVLNAALEVKRDAAGIGVVGQVHGQGNQPCVASGEPVPFLVTERINLRLVFEVPGGGEIELATADLDVEPLLGDIVDVGEIAAQAFALGLDPYPRSAVKVPGLLSEAEAVAARSPFAVLKKD
ncbi:MAG: YceD family protein [Sandarakinorhabdus sp.]